MRTLFCFSTVADGNIGLHVGDPAAAQQNRRRLEHRLGLPAGRVLYLEQVHGTAVAQAEQLLGASSAVPQGGNQESPSLPDPGPEAERAAAPTADAAVTAAGCPLAVMTADCLPVILCTEDPQRYAVAHAGRRGLLEGVLPRVVDALYELGARRISAVLGPAICGCCYEVSPEMAAEAEQQLPGIRARTSWGSPSLDLPAAARTQLRGLEVEVSEEASPCTREDPRWFSHRRAPGRGRFAGIVYPGLSSSISRPLRGADR